MVHYSTGQSRPAIGESKMNAIQKSNARKLREMKYRFNSVVEQGSSVILRQEVTLLTNKTFTLDVATLHQCGTVEMHDDIAL